MVSQSAGQANSHRKHLIYFNLMFRFGMFFFFLFCFVSSCIADVSIRYMSNIDVLSERQTDFECVDVNAEIDKKYELKFYHFYDL